MGDDATRRAAANSMKLVRTKLLHDTFRVGIVLKGIDGLLETIGGLLVWLVRPSTAVRIVRVLFRHELAEDPHDFLATHLLGASRQFASSKGFASAFLLGHGLTKIVLVVALWFNRLWAYPLMIVVLGAFSVWQIARFTQTHSLLLALLTAFDLLIVGLTWREYREQKRLRATRAGGVGAAR
jgi:uncharacterized membrane protein